MPGDDFYMEKTTPQWRTTEFNATAGASIWTPTTSTKVILTGLHVANAAAPSGTFVITIGNVGGSKVAEFFVAGSATISPCIGPIESTVYDRPIFGFPASSPSGGWKITAYGFEID